jgi:branched-chain amino acid transport system ATP-binding protein
MDSFSRIPGAFWGNSLFDLIEDCVNMCNAAARALANNLGISSGPQVGVNIDRIASGEDVSEMGVVERRMRGLSRSFQRTSIFGQMLVGKQVELASHKMGVEDSHADAKAVLQELDLWRVANIEAQELGYGEQRRLDLALALVGRPSVLLLDEPMAGLSVKESLDLAQHLKRLTSSWDVSVLLVEHDMDVVFGISDVVTVFELGRVISSGEPSAVRADPRVREAYLGSAA